MDGRGYDPMAAVGTAGVATGMNAQTAYNSSHDQALHLTREMGQYAQQSDKLLRDIQNLLAQAETLHRLQEDVNREREYLESQEILADEKIRTARDVIARYQVVNDPVVASDGFTYERHVITEYLQSKANAKETPMSQQTDKPLTSLLVPNRALTSMVQRLCDIIGTADAQAERQQQQQQQQQQQGLNGQGMRLGGTAKGGAAGTTPVAPATEAGAAGGGGDSGSARRDEGGRVIELNALGERVHPCIRVYSFCNYKDGCAYAQYPYEACLSNLKGKCRFKNRCHEAHVHFVGPLNEYGQPVSAPTQQHQQHQHQIPRPRQQQQQQQQQQRQQQAKDSGSAPAATETESK